MAGLAAGIAGGQWPLAIAGGGLAAVTFFLAPEMLGFVFGGGLYLMARTIDLGAGELYLLNVGSFLLPLYFMIVFVLLRKRAGTLARLLRCWEFWAVSGLWLLLLAGLPGSLDADYGLQKVKYYLANNLVCFFGPVLASAAWGKRGLHRFLKGVFLGGLALTAYFWISASYLDLPLNIYAVLDFNPIGLSRLVGVFFLLAVCAGFLPLRAPVRLALAVAAGCAMVLLDARGPALALVLALLWAGLVHPDPRFRLFPVLSLLVFILLAALVPLYHWMSPHLFSLDDTGRLGFYHAALAVFAQNPLTGAGTGSFAALAPVEGALYPHNLFLETAAELGVLGLALSVALVFAPWGRLALARRRDGDITLAGALLVYCFVNAMVSGDITTNFLLWLAAGVTASLVVAREED